jgi:beta-mannan synthase
MQMLGGAEMQAHHVLTLLSCFLCSCMAQSSVLQVCDDSTRESVRQKVDAAVISCLEQGHNVQLVRRDNRSGFKAGAMVDGMTRVEDQGYEYVAIFDADFEPPEDFLYQTIIHMVSTETALAFPDYFDGCSF